MGRHLAGKKVHLVCQDAAVGQDQILGFVGYIGGEQQLHAGLLWRAATLALVAGAAGGHHVHPDVLAALGNRVHMIPGQTAAGKAIATIGADMAVPLEQFAIGEGRYLVQRAATQGLAADGDDAVSTDGGALAGDAVDAAVEGETVVADAPGHHVPSIIEACMLPVHPAMRGAVLVQRKNEGRCAHGNTYYLDMT